MSVHLCFFLLVFVSFCPQSCVLLSLEGIDVDVCSSRAFRTVAKNFRVDPSFRECFVAFGVGFVDLGSGPASLSSLRTMAIVAIRYLRIDKFAFHSGSVSWFFMTFDFWQRPKAAAPLSIVPVVFMTYWQRSGISTTHQYGTDLGLDSWVD